MKHPLAKAEASKHAVRLWRPGSHDYPWEFTALVVYEELWAAMRRRIQARRWKKGQQQSL